MSSFLSPAFQLGLTALHLTNPELEFLRSSLPDRTLTRPALDAFLSSLNLSHPPLSEILFSLSDLHHTAEPLVPHFIAVYATLRALAFSPSNQLSISTALYLAFTSAGGATVISSTHWLAFAEQVGVTIGGVDCIPNTDVARLLRRRWRLERGRLRSLFNDYLPFHRFLRVVNSDDAGLLLCLRAVGFVLVHALVKISGAPVPVPDWLGESDSRFLSQYMTFAIDRALSAPIATRKGASKVVSGHNEKYSDKSSPISNVSNASPFSDARSTADTHRPTSTPTASKPPRPDVASIDPAHLPHRRSVSSDGPTVHGNPTSTKPAVVIVRRSRHVSGDSPFQIDYSSLQLGDRIGSGAYGDVYHGTFLMSPVAVKMFHVNIAKTAGSGPGICGERDTDDPNHMSHRMSMTALQRFASQDSQAKYKTFLREVEMMSVVRHPNLVLYMGACGDPVTPLCIVCELFTGGSLYDYLHVADDFRPSVMMAIQFALSIARGMFYLHSSQPSILHRDLKSRNILLSGRKGVNGDPHVVICDFGLCQLFGEDGHGHGAPVGMGTASYMSPNVINGEKYEASDDVYSYGVLLYEIFTGCVPYNGMRAMQVMFHVSTRGARPTCKHDVQIPGVIRDVIEDCWAEDRKKRPSFDAIIERLIAIEKSPP